MPFTFKLSQRLARMRRPALSASGAASVAHEAPQRHVVQRTQPQVAWLVVSPVKPRFERTHMQQVFASAGTEVGDHISATISGGSP